VLSVNPTEVAAVLFAGDPDEPALVHQVELDRS
jgi:hypothetical protein